MKIQVFLDLFEKLQIEVERFTVQMKRNRAHEEDLERELKKTKAELQRAGSEIRHLQALNKVFHKESKQAASASTSSKRTRIIKVSVFPYFFQMKRSTRV